MAEVLKSALPLSCEARKPPRIHATAGIRREALWIGIALSLAAREVIADPALENNFRSLAAWCHQLTSKLSIAPPDGLLLEVQGSLKLFGGLEAIKCKLVDEIRSRNLPFNVSTAPTPLGALWLARHGSVDILDADGLRRHLCELPLEVTAWPDSVIALFADMGVSRIGDCLRLPRHGFARRAGLECREDLDKALGERVDPRIELGMPESLEWEIDLALESTNRALLLQAVERMLDRLVVDLRRLQCQTQELEIGFYHRKRPATVKHLRLVQPAIEKARFLQPLSVQLEYMSLPAPVIGVSLRVPAIEALNIEAPKLFDCGVPAADRSSQAGLIECLRGRLRPEEVFGLAVKAEHRPEKVWVKRIDLSSGTGLHEELSPWAHRRPLWLLPAPLPLADGIARFRYQGRVQALMGPERIQSGWWDGEDVGRDYYTAATEAGERLWVYRDRLSRAWYLHGIFG